MYNVQNKTFFAWNNKNQTPFSYVYKKEEKEEKINIFYDLAIGEKGIFIKDMIECINISTLSNSQFFGNIINNPNYDAWRQFYVLGGASNKTVGFIYDCFYFLNKITIATNSDTQEIANLESTSNRYAKLASSNCFYFFYDHMDLEQGIYSKKHITFSNVSAKEIYSTISVLSSNNICFYNNIYCITHFFSNNDDTAKKEELTCFNMSTKSDGYFFGRLSIKNKNMIACGNMYFGFLFGGEYDTQNINYICFNTQSNTKNFGVLSTNTSGGNSITNGDRFIVAYNNSMYYLDYTSMVQTETFGDLESLYISSNSTGFSGN